MCTSGSESRSLAAPVEPCGAIRGFRCCRVLRPVQQLGGQSMRCDPYRRVIGWLGLRHPIPLFLIGLALVARHASGQLSFGLPVKYSVGDDPFVVRTADFNGDGLPDVLLGSLNGLTLLMNNGDGSLGTPVPFGESLNGGGGATGTVIAADLNGDGRPDIAFSGGHRVGVMLNKGNGTFFPTVYYNGGAAQFNGWIAAGDFFKTGRVDLVLFEVGSFACCKIFTLFKNQGNGSFQKHSQFASPGGTASRGIIAADVNNDGYSDLVTTDWNEPLGTSILINNQNGSFRFAFHYGSGPAQGIAVKDLNRDGKPDVILWSGWSSSQLSFVTEMNKGDGSLFEPVFYPPSITGGGLVESAAIEDFDLNGTPDLAVATAPGRIAIVRGKGDGTFNTADTIIPLPFSLPAFPGFDDQDILAAADLTGNGTADLVVIDRLGKSVYVILNTTLPERDLGLRLSTARGGNAGAVTLTIFGQAIRAGDTATLQCAGQQEIVGRNVTITQAALTTTFDLARAMAGTCNVVLTHLDRTTSVVPQTFTVEQGGAPDIWVDIVGRTAIRAAREQTYILSIANRGNIDAGPTRVWITFPQYITWATTPDWAVASSGQKSGQTYVAFDVSVSAGVNKVIPIVLTAPNGPQYAHQLFKIQGWIEAQ